MPSRNRIHRDRTLSTHLTQRGAKASSENGDAEHRASAATVGASRESIIAGIALCEALSGRKIKDGISPRGVTGTGEGGALAAAGFSTDGNGASKEDSGRGAASGTTIIADDAPPARRAGAFPPVGTIPANGGGGRPSGCGNHGFAPYFGIIGHDAGGLAPLPYQASCENGGRAYGNGGEGGGSSGAKFQDPAGNSHVAPGACSAMEHGTFVQELKNHVDRWKENGPADGSPDRREEQDRTEMRPPRSAETRKDARTMNDASRGGTSPADAGLGGGGGRKNTDSRKKAKTEGTGDGWTHPAGAGGDRGLVAVAKNHWEVDGGSSSGAACSDDGSAPLAGERTIDVDAEDASVPDASKAALALLDLADKNGATGRLGRPTAGDCAAGTTDRGPGSAVEKWDDFGVSTKVHSLESSQTYVGAGFCQINFLREELAIAQKERNALIMQNGRVMEESRDALQRKDEQHGAATAELRQDIEQLWEAIGQLRAERAGPVSQCLNCARNESGNVDGNGEGRVGVLISTEPKTLLSSSIIGGSTVASDDESSLDCPLSLENNVACREKRPMDLLLESAEIAVKAKKRVIEWRDGLANSHECPDHAPVEKSGPSWCDDFSI